MGSIAERQESAIFDSYGVGLRISAFCGEVNKAAGLL
jgi:hypothetical protein